MFTKIKNYVKRVAAKALALVGIGAAVAVSTPDAQAQAFSGSSLISSATSEITGQLGSASGLLTVALGILGMFLLWRLVKRFVK